MRLAKATKYPQFVACQWRLICPSAKEWENAAPVPHMLHLTVSYGPQPASFRPFVHSCHPVTGVHELYLKSPYRGQQLQDGNSPITTNTSQWPQPVAYQWGYASLSKDRDITANPCPSVEACRSAPSDMQVFLHYIPVYIVRICTLIFLCAPCAETW